MPLLGRLELRDCSRLIIYNIQGFSTRQIWMELMGCLRDLARSIIKVKQVSGLNRNPHADVWVHRDTGAALVAVIHSQTRTQLWKFIMVVTETQRRQGNNFNTANWGGDEQRFAAVTHWRLAIWQLWWESVMIHPNFSHPCRTPSSSPYPRLSDHYH